MAGIETPTPTPTPTQVFSAAPKAKGAGVPIQKILNSGHWAKESTFARYFKKKEVTGPGLSFGFISSPYATIRKTLLTHFYVVVVVLL